MNRCAILSLLALLVILHASVIASPMKEDVKCPNGNLNEDSFSLVTLTTKDEQNHWVTTFTTEKASTNSKDGLIVDVRHSVVECDHKQIIKVHGAVRASNPGSAITIPPIQNTICIDRLQFHITKGEHVEITNNGRTAFRTTGNSYGSVLTNRMLERNEMFEVVIEELKPDEGQSFGIGLSSIPASQYPFDYWMKSGWILYDNLVHVNGKGNINYPVNLGGTKVGDRIGVRRKDNGDVHFYINGVDKGVAVTGVPAAVYGAFDLFQKGVRGSIIDNCN